MLKRLIRHPAAQALLAWLVGLYLRLIWATTRWQLEGAEHAKVKRGDPLILAFWHECLPLAAQGWRLMGQQIPAVSGLRAQALISRHRDGRLIARAVAPFDVEVVHASSCLILKRRGGGAAPAFAGAGRRRGCGDHTRWAARPGTRSGTRHRPACGFGGAAGAGLRGGIIAHAPGKVLGPDALSATLRPRRGGD